MSDFNKYKTYAEYLNAEKVGAECNISFRIPLPNPQTGAVNFPGMSGSFEWAFEDGVVMRANGGQQFFKWQDMQYIEFPSQIQAVRGGLPMQA